MVTAAKITADLLANDAKFVEGMNRAATAVGRFAQQAQKDIQNTGKQFDRLVNSITGIKSALGTFATVAGIALLTKSALESADAIDKLAIKLGLSTDAIQKYEYAAKQSGASNDDLLTSFNFLNKLIENGQVPYKNLGQAINDIASRMESATTGAQRAGLAFDVFGKTGVALIPMFARGADGLRQLGDEAERLGAVLPEDTIRRATQFKDQMDALGTVITKNFQAGMLKEFTDDSGKLRDIYSDPAFVHGVETLGQAFGLVAKGAIAVVEAYQKASEIVAKLGLAAGTDLGLVDPDVMREVLRGDPDAGKNKGLNDAVKKAKSGGGFAGSPRLDKKVAPENQLQKYIDNLNKETDAIGLSERALQQQRAEIQAQNAARTDYENHLRASPKLTEDEANAIKDAAGKFYDLKQAQQQAEKFNQEFKAGFEDAASSIITGSKSIKEAIKDLILQFALLIEKEYILGPIADQLFGAKGTSSPGGGAGGFLSGILGSAGGGGGFLSGAFGSQGSLARLFQTGNAGFIGPLPSYDIGTNYVPHDQVAMIHQGEKIVPASQNNSVMEGNNFYINAPGASKSDITELKALMFTLAGPGKVEERVANARRRGSL